MNLKALYSKIHRATVTDAQLHYEGSITIDKYLMDEAGLTEYQAVNIYNIKTGARFETYVIEGEAHSGIIQVNGAAAHLAKTGDLVIIASYAYVSQEEMSNWHPKLVFVDANNRPTSNKPELMPV